MRNEDRDLRRGDRAPVTYHSLAGVDAALENTGRFSSRATIAGEEPAVHYPAASGPWADPVQPGLEPPTGIAIDEQEPVGTAQEIAASLSELADESAAGPPALARMSTAPSISSVIPAPTAISGSTAVGDLAASSSSMAPAVLPAVETEGDDAAIHAKLRALLSKGIRRRL
jgi:hypothetical protein